MTEKDIEDFEKQIEEAVKEIVIKEFESQCPMFKNIQEF